MLEFFLVFIYLLIGMNNNLNYMNRLWLEIKHKTNQ